MKAVVCPRYGPPEVLQLAELETPVPKPGEVLVRVRATAVTSSDCIVRGFRVPAALWIPARLMLGVTKPRKPVLGMVLSGDVAAVGKGVETFREDDEVFGFDRFAMGAYAELKRVAARGLLARKPTNLSHAEAAAIPFGGLLALHFLREGGIRAGQKVLVYGASGAVGTSAVQLAARHFGAEVTGVCSAANRELVRSCGAAAAIDYTSEDFTRADVRYDLVFVAVGRRVGPPSREDCQRVLADDGVCVSVDRGGPKITVEDLVLLARLAEERVLKPVIDRCYPFEQIADAHRYVDEGRKRGNVVVTVP